MLILSNDSKIVPSISDSLFCPGNQYITHIHGRRFRWYYMTRWDSNFKAVEDTHWSWRCTLARWGLHSILSGIQHWTATAVRQPGQRRSQQVAAWKGSLIRGAKMGWGGRSCSRVSHSSKSFPLESPRTGAWTWVLWLVSGTTHQLHHQKADFCWHGWTVAYLYRGVLILRIHLCYTHPNIAITQMANWKWVTAPMLQG